MLWRTLFHKAHLYIGLIAGIVIFCVAFSGCLLVFRAPMESFLYPRLYRLSKIGKKLPVDSLLHIAAKELQSKEWLYFETAHNPEKPFVLAYPKNKSTAFLALNPYNGKVLSYDLSADNFFYPLLSFHRYLLLGKTGKTITGISALCLLFLLSSGLYLWLPKRMKNLKKNLFPRLKKASKKKIIWVAHSVLGVYIFPLSLFIVLTGVCFSYKNVRSSIYYIFDFKAKPARKITVPPDSTREAFSWQKIIAQVEKKVSNTGDLRVRKNKGKNSPIEVRETHYGKYIQRSRNMFFFTPQGRLFRSEIFHESSRGERMNRLLYSLHTGTIFSYFSLPIYFLISLLVSMMPITGVIMYYLRYGKKMKRKKPQKLSSQPTI